jgi:O-antigen/teichoic acid export membrane protein
LAESIASTGKGTVRSGVLTGISTVAVSASAAVLGVVLSREFGHGVRTDGFFASYNIYLALVLVASGLRVIVLPRFAAARSAGRLPQEAGAWIGVLAVPLAAILAVALIWPHAIASALTSNPATVDVAEKLLPWVVVSAVAQIVAGVVASALAALDDYDWAAYGFAAGSVAGVVLTVVFVHHGIVAFGWGLALNGVLTFGIPLLGLLRRRGVAYAGFREWRHLVVLGEGIAIPFALQGLYLIGYRFASGLGTGHGTTFSYAYLIASFLVAVTATSVALVSTVPFAREGATPARVARHVVAVSWLSLAPIAGAAGVFALVGEPIARRVLGGAYSGETGSELGRLVVYLSPWMVVSVAVTVTFPLVFVRGRAGWLPVLAVVALGAQVLLAWGGRAAFGLAGIAGALALSTALVQAALLVALGAFATVARGVLVAALICGSVATVVFALSWYVLGPILGAIAGAILYSVVLLAWRPRDLRTAWAYVHALQ